MTRKELALLAVSSLATLLAALGLIRWLAPGLLGGPRDLELVQLDERVPPFYEGVFRAGDFQTTDLLLKDPRTVNRPRPFHSELPWLGVGPHDVLGFRNRAVPSAADVVTIGDSQTYGLNVQLEDAWPVQMGAQLRGAAVYNMSIGGWGAVQYLDMFLNALAFRPRVIVVAFYSGNDALDSVTTAYGSPLWRELRPVPELSVAAPSPVIPTPESEQWRPALRGGPVAFTPKLRLDANREHPAVDAGYGVIGKVAELMASTAVQREVGLIFTIIPTKELAFAPQIAAEGAVAPADYVELVRVEQRRIAELADRLRRLPGAAYVDVVAPLQQAVAGGGVYPGSANGHPLSAGHRVIGNAVATAVASLLPEAPTGWVTVPSPDGEGGTGFMLIRDGHGLYFRTHELLEANGWKGVRARFVSPRDVAGIPKHEVLEADPKRYGPR